MRFENMRLEVLREVDEIRNGIDRDVAAIRDSVGNDLTEIKSDVKNLKWIFGIALGALFTIFSIMLAIVAALANII